MRGIKITAAALFFGGLACTFYGTQALNSTVSKAAELTTPQQTSGATADVNEKIQKLSSSNPKGAR